MTFQESNGAVTFAVKVLPRASKHEIVGVEGDAIKIRLKASPVEGKANLALIAFLAETLDVSHTQIEIISGETSRRKLVRVRRIALELMKSSLEKQAAGVQPAAFILP